jgi:hypothetical protein
LISSEDNEIEDEVRDDRGALDCCCATPGSGIQTLTLAIRRLGTFLRQQIIEQAEQFRLASHLGQFFEAFTDSLHPVSAVDKSE